MHASAIPALWARAASIQRRPSVSRPCPRQKFHIQPLKRSIVSSSAAQLRYVPASRRVPRADYRYPPQARSPWHTAVDRGIGDGDILTQRVGALQVIHRMAAARRRVRRPLRVVPARILRSSASIPKRVEPSGWSRCWTRLWSTRTPSPSRTFVVAIADGFGCLQRPAAAENRQPPEQVLARLTGSRS